MKDYGAALLNPAVSVLRRTGPIMFITVIFVLLAIWNLAKQKESGYRPKLNEALLDFKIGYFGTAFLALCFLSLGALLMYGSGEELSNKGVVFAGQLINLYTSSIGKWAYIIIAIAAATFLLLFFFISLLASTAFSSAHLDMDAS